MMIKKVLRNFLHFCQFSVFILCLVEEKAKMIRGGLELESFSINPPRITILIFLPQWLCAEMEVISVPEFMYNSSFSTLLQHAFVYLKGSPYLYVIFVLQLHILPPQGIRSFKVGEPPSKIKFTASDVF